MTMTFNSKKFWIERNSIDNNRQQINDLLRYFGVEDSRYEIYQGEECLKVKRKLDYFKIAIDEYECCIKLFGKNTFNRGQNRKIEKEKYRLIAKFDGDNAWYDVLKSLFAYNTR